LNDLIPCLGVIGILVVVFGFILILRYINYRETLALAEKGLPRPEPASDSRTLLRWGILVTALGVALTIGLYPLGFSGGGSRYPLGLGPWMLGGFVPLFLGIGLILLHYLSPGKDR
jgi:hypothetical protein